MLLVVYSNSVGDEAVRSNTLGILSLRIQLTLGRRAQGVHVSS